MTLETRSTIFFCTGVDVSLEKSQGLLDQFAAAKYFDQSLVDTLKSLGVRQVSRLEQAGITSDVTVEQIERIITTRAAIMALRDRVNTLQASVDELDSAWASGEEIDVPTFEDLVG